MARWRADLGWGGRWARLGSGKWNRWARRPLVDGRKLSKLISASGGDVFRHRADERRRNERARNQV